MMAALRSGNDQARRFLALETATAGWKSRRRYRTATSALFNPGRTPITIDTFNFTRYGLLRGQLLTLSQDVVMHDLQFRSEHFRSVPKTCRTAGHRLNLPEAGAELSGGSIFRWCVSLNFSKARPTTGTPRAGLAKIAQDRAADAVLGTGLLLFSLRAGYWRRGAGTATAHIGLYCRGGPSGLLGRTFPTMSGAPQPTSTRAERGKARRSAGRAADQFNPLLNLKTAKALDPHHAADAGARRRRVIE
jgi:hypothetical protein